MGKLRKCFAKCREYGISLNPEKCMFFVFSGVILGYIVSKHGKFPDPKKIEAVVNMPIPRTPHDVQILLGIAQFNRTFIKNFAHASGHRNVRKHLRPSRKLTPMHLF